MPLTIQLKPGERIILGEYDITNTERTRLVFHNENVTILREKDILTFDQANTPAKRLYFTVQQMYVLKDAQSQRDAYHELSRAMLQSAPRTRLQLENINKHIAAGEMYKALKEAKVLIQAEQN
jgi:flagellar protein FlbT